MREREETAGAVRFDIDRHQGRSAKLAGREGENDSVGSDDLAIDAEMSREDITALFMDRESAAESSVDFDMLRHAARCGEQPCAHGLWIEPGVERPPVLYLAT